MLKCMICNEEFDPENKKDSFFDDICEQCEETRDELTNGKEE